MPGQTGLLPGPPTITACWNANPRARRRSRGARSARAAPSITARATSAGGASTGRNGAERSMTSPSAPAGAEAASASKRSNWARRSAPGADRDATYASITGPIAETENMPAQGPPASLRNGSQSRAASTRASRSVHGSRPTQEVPHESRSWPGRVMPAARAAEGWSNAPVTASVAVVRPVSAAASGVSGPTATPEPARRGSCVSRRPSRSRKGRCQRRPVWFCRWKVVAVE